MTCVVNEMYRTRIRSQTKMGPRDSSRDGSGRRPEKEDLGAFCESFGGRLSSETGPDETVMRAACYLCLCDRALNICGSALTMFGIVLQV